MVIISHKHKFIIFKTYKTASTSIEDFVSQRLKKTLKPDECILGQCQKLNITKHITPKKLFSILPEVKDYYKICAIRNPYNQIASSFIYENKYIPTECQLREFILGCDCVPENVCNIRRTFQHLKTYYSYVLYDGKECIDYFIKLETHKEDLARLLDKFEIPYGKRIEMGHKRKNMLNYKLEDVYNSETIGLVQRIFEHELKLGNYTYPGINE